MSQWQENEKAREEFLAVRTREEREIAEQTVAALLRIREREGKSPINREIKNGHDE